MIISRLQGGLGNQMFQYAAGRVLSLKRNDKYFLDTQIFFQKDIPGITNRDYELAVFNIDTPFATKAHINKFFPGKYSNKVSGLISRFLYKNPDFKVVYETDSMNALPLEDPIANIYLSGFWQSEDYFMHEEEVIRKEFTFRDIPNAKNAELLKEIRNTNSVSLHIRRSDYITNINANKLMGVCSVEYYQNSISYINSMVTDPVFFIFSDEPDWVKENFGIAGKSVIISHNNGSKSFEDMRLMSNCRHHIIANSSFSWWGAWLNNSDSKIVVAPKEWFADAHKNKEAKNLVPAAWMRF